MMLTRYERKERLGFGGQKRVAERARRADGKPYSASRISQVVNCEKTGVRNQVIENAIVTEINESTSVLHNAPAAPLTHADVFPPVPERRGIALVTSE